MAITVTCPGCRTTHSVTEDLLGKTIRCKKCQETFTAKAARTAVAAGRIDERIQKAPVEVDDDEFEPRNGTPRARGQQPPKNNTLIIAGSIGGVTILGLAAALVWVLNRDPEPTTNPTPAPLTFNNPSNNPSPSVTPTSTPADVKPTDGKPGDAKATEKLAADSKTEGDVKPPKDNKPTTAQMTTAAELFGAVRMPRPANFNHEAVERAKKSAVIIYCVFEQGGGYGSGWVAEKKGDERYIITNSHVVNMKEREKPPPDKIEVTFDSGLPTARTFEGKLLALDREEDLAVIRVKGPDLPEPLKIAPSFDLVETQKLLILGFPFGGMLKDLIKNGLGVEVTTSLKARESTVSGRMYNKETGSVKYIEVEGGADPGNSGGAVIDTNGNVSAILVAGNPQSNQRWVIPSEYAMHLLAGRMLKVIPGQAIRSGSSIKQPFHALVADPMKRIRSVSVDVWPGQPIKQGIKIRSASGSAPQPVEGDGEHVTTTVNYNSEEQVKIGEAHTVDGELTLPALKEGEVYWFQPHYVAKDGKERWGEAVMLEMGRYPVDAKSANLTIKHKPDLKPDEFRKVELTSRTIQGIEVEGFGGLGARELGIRANLTEKIRLVEPNGDARVRFQYTDVHLNDPERDTAMRKQLRGVLESVKSLGAEVIVTRDGRFRSPKADFAQVPQGARGILGVFNSQVLESLETLELALPNRDMTPGDTWTTETPYTINFTLVTGQPRTENALFRTTCKFIGTRVRDGREEAVVELTGSVVRNENANSGANTAGGVGEGTRGAGRPGGGSGDSDVDEDGQRKRGVYGVSHGAALIDIETGLVTLARSESDVVVVSQVTVRGPNNQEAAVNVHVGLYLDTTLQRSMTKGKLVTVTDLSTLLPNMPKDYNPLVGVGAPMSAESPTKPSTTVVPERTTNLPQDLLRKIQHAAVRIDVETAEGGGSGSGWFAEPGLVVTNCHVVDMTSKSARKPTKITVIIDSGTDTERKLPGKLLSIDREDDLAVIKVDGDNLPEPMKIKSAESLVDATILTVFGFPFGTQNVDLLQQGLGARDLKTTLKTRKTSVSGRVIQTDQTVKYINYEGGGDPGNSGSAVVDNDGFVRCIHVASLFDPRVAGKKMATKMGIPAEYAQRLLLGYPLEIETPYAYFDGSTPRQPIKIMFGDPLRRVSRAAIDVWVGSAGTKQRKPSESLPKPSSGDSVRQTFDLKLELDSSGLFMDAVGEFPLPARSPGQVFWLQPRFVNSSGKEQWGRAIAFSPDGSPVKRDAVVLEHKLPKADTVRTIELNSEAVFRWQQLDEMHAEGNPLKAVIEEKVIKPLRGSPRVQMSYKDLIWNLPISTGDPRADSQIRQLLRQFTDLIKGVVTVMTVNDKGVLKTPLTDYSRVPLGGVLFTKTFNDQLMQSLVAMSIPFPNKQVKYLDTWQHPTNLFIETRNRFEGSLFNMNFKYMGVRDRGGRQEAVIEIEGSLAHDDKVKSVDEKELKTGKPGDPPTSPQPDPPPPGPESLRDQYAKKPGGKARGLYGIAKGYAYLDVAGGYVSEVKLFIDVDVEMTIKDPDTKVDLPVPAGGTMEILFKRLTNTGSR